MFSFAERVFAWFADYRLSVTNDCGHVCCFAMDWGVLGRHRDPAKCNFQLMQLICSTFEISCSTFNWVDWFSTQPYLVSQSSYLINNCFRWFYRNVFGITSFFVWLTFECWGQLCKLIVQLFMKRPNPIKSSVTCMQLLLIATTGIFNNCVLSSSILFSFNSITQAHLNVYYRLNFYFQKQLISLLFY